MTLSQCLPLRPTNQVELLINAARDAANALKEFQAGDPNRHSADLARTALLAAVAARSALAGVPLDDADMNTARRDVGIMYDEAKLAYARNRDASAKHACDVACAARRDRIAAKRLRRDVDKQRYAAAKAACQQAQTPGGSA